MPAPATAAGGEGDAPAPAPAPAPAALQRAMALAVDRLNEEKERARCLGACGGGGGVGGGGGGDPAAERMLGADAGVGPDADAAGGGVGRGRGRRAALDALFVCWGLGTWLGVNGLYVQLPLLVERLPEGWALPSAMALAVQLANVGLPLYALLRRVCPRAPDAPYIYALLVVGAAALTLNAFLYQRTTPLGAAGEQRSLAFLVLTFCAALVGCTSSVLFYPYLRHFRDVYLATYLVGEGLSGFVPAVLALAQGVGGEPVCAGGVPHYSPPRFDTSVFLLVLGGLAALSLASFAAVDASGWFAAERAAPGAAAKREEAAPRPALRRGAWAAALALLLALNALANGVLPSVQSYSCMPYGTRAYHLAATLGAMANPAACLAGVWLPPAPPRLLAALLAPSLAPLGYILATALLSPAPPLRDQPLGVAIIVVSWVWTCGVVSYARMWLYAWARAGGARGMRAAGVATQLGSAAGSLLLFLLVNYTALFVAAPVCPLPLVANLTAPQTI